MNHQAGLIAIFSDRDALYAALRELKSARLEVREVYSPSGQHGLDEALGWKRSPVRFFTLGGGIAGAASGFGLAAYSARQWNFIVGGRPVLAWIPFGVVGFEFTILLAVLFTVAGMLICCRLPQRVDHGRYDSRFSQDKFGILVACPGERREEAEVLLKETGAEEIHEHTIAQP